MEAPADLLDAASSLGVRLSSGQLKSLERFVDHLRRWNRRINGLSRRDIDRVWTRHVLDSLSLKPILDQQAAARGLVPDPSNSSRVLDIGTGAGFPGLPLAVAAPEIEFLLLDRSEKKQRFLDMVIADLGLPNVTTRCVDAAGFENEGSFQFIVSRAVARPEVLWKVAAHLLAEYGGGVMVLMSGAADADSATTGGASVGTFEGASSREIRPVRIPGLDRAHEVTIIRN